MARHNDFGNIGENKAVEYLQENGYSIVTKNWRVQHLEIDIIAIIDRVLCFVEVKTRSSKRYGEAFKALTITKQKNLLKAADLYIQENNIDLDIRFDLITITKVKEGVELLHFKDVFVPFQF